jgi:hypothetical protein
METDETMLELGEGWLSALCGRGLGLGARGQVYENGINSLM